MSGPGARPGDLPQAEPRLPVLEDGTRAALAAMAAAHVYSLLADAAGLRRAVELAEERGGDELDRGHSSSPGGSRAG